MALVGGGGAPNVAGGNPAGTGTALNYIGNHVYGYSGLVQTQGDNTYKTAMEFTTGGSYAVGQVQLCPASGNNDDLVFKISMDGQAIGEFYTDTPPSELNPSALPILIPPQTKVLIEIKNAQGSTARDTYILIIGEVYA
tara:strand:+ start:41 stop:457 length:417 start_codon:yes stop_codon:yes gene_type:complete